MKAISFDSEDTARQMLEELAGESERACAIVAVAYLDDLLLQLLEQYLVENREAYHDLLDADNGNAVLSSFGSRIIMASAIGIISPTDLKALRKLKDIRNRFAHRMDMTFAHSKIQSLIQALKDLVPKQVVIGDSLSPCETFISAAGYYSGLFSGHLRIMKKLGITGGFSTVVNLFMRTGDISSFKAEIASLNEKAS